MLPCSKAMVTLSIKARISRCVDDDPLFVFFDLGNAVAFGFATVLAFGLRNGFALGFVRRFTVGLGGGLDCSACSAAAFLVRRAARRLFF